MDFGFDENRQNVSGRLEHLASIYDSACHDGCSSLSEVVIIRRKLKTNDKIISSIIVIIIIISTCISINIIF